MKLAILNTSIVTSDGTYSLSTITLEQARALAQSEPIDSAVGHESTAVLLSTLLGVDVPVNRQLFQQQPGQRALVCKLNGRPPEGAVLTLEDLEKIGYSFKVLTRTDTGSAALTVLQAHAAHLETSVPRPHDHLEPWRHISTQDHTGHELRGPAADWGYKGCIPRVHAHCDSHPTAQCVWLSTAEYDQAVDADKAARLVQDTAWAEETIAWLEAGA
ncbi:YddF family protein [Acrocarpospora sp. B8E8]|uniref:YddF family protein n=1 Tax=Acrocarpospora sp. B8E8 TaxID=3153572 RepID=UPI00325E96BC